MLRSLRPDTLLQRFCVAAGVIGIVAGIVGPSDVGWNIQGVAMGLYLAALGVFINE